MIPMRTTTTHILIVGDMEMPYLPNGRQPAGAANVARNAAELGASVGLLSLDGKENANEAKLRAQLAQFEALLPQYDVVVLSHYPNDSLINVKQMIAAVNILGKRILVDPKSHDFSPFAGVFLLMPHQSELDRNIGGWVGEEELTVKVQQLRASLNIEALLLFRAGEGMTVYTDHQIMHFPAIGERVIDASTLCDTIIAGMAVMLGAGTPIMEAAACASQVAHNLN